jgi:hypothetical protein
VRDVFVAVQCNLDDYLMRGVREEPSNGSARSSRRLAACEAVMAELRAILALASAQNPADCNKANDSMLQRIERQVSQLAQATAGSAP